MKATRLIFIVTNNCLPKSIIYRLPFIMPKARRSLYSMAFKLKVVAEVEAVENNSEIARDYGLSESMVRRWCRDQAKLFNGERKMSAKCTTMGRFTPKYPELDQQIMEWFTEQRSRRVTVWRWFVLKTHVSLFQCVGIDTSYWSDLHFVMTN